MSRSIFVVDDDPIALAFAEAAARVAGFEPRRFESAEALLAGVTPDDRGCLVLDLHLSGMTGLQLQAELRRLDVRLPVIVVSGQSDVSSAVTAMKQEAFDFFEKPVSIERLADSIRRAVADDARRAEAHANDAQARRRYASLTLREKQVMDSVVAGMANKQIAARYELSEKTIEVHRGNVMRKMGVDSVAALVRAAIVCDRQSPPPTVAPHAAPPRTDPDDGSANRA